MGCPIRKTSKLPVKLIIKMQEMRIRIHIAKRHLPKRLRFPLQNNRNLMNNIAKIIFSKFN
jgi:hypothetical protein